MKVLDEQTQRMCPALSSLGAAALVSLRRTLLGQTFIYKFAINMKLICYLETPYYLFAHYPNPFDPL